jgi:Fe-Mn family superoxide dismutase
MRRAAYSASLALAANPVSASVEARREHGFVMHLPKSDIKLGKFEFTDQYKEFMQRSGRVPDYTVEKYRTSFWRIDEYIRRSEKHLAELGFFYLPTLDFPWYKGCMPLFSAYQLRLHYGRHHRAYVEKLNKLIEGTDFYGQNLAEIVVRSSSDPRHAGIFNNAAQHFNHCFFWKSLMPHGSNMPPDLEKAIVEQFGSVANLQSAFSQAALALFGSGWVYLVLDRQTAKFDIVSYSNAGCPLVTPHLQPLICIDVWEHTYYVDYENDRAKFVSKYFDCVDWDWAERGWKKAMNMPYEEMKWS